MVTLRRTAALACLLALAACGGGEEKQASKKSADAPKKGPPATLVTVTVARPRTVEVVEEVVGTLENVVDPVIGAEVAGRVTRVAGFVGKRVKRGELLAEIDAADFELQGRADAAEVARLETLFAQQERLVERQHKLAAQGFISQNAADDAQAQRNALRESLAAARTRAEQTKRNLGKTRVVSPIDGEIEVQNVSAGAFVRVGDPLFRMVGVRQLRARLPLPERVATRVKPGLKVRLVSPAAPEMTIEDRIEELRPTLGAQSRALEAIVRFEVPGGALRGGGSINARIVVATRENAMMVPETSVVLRPAGKVVYAVVEGRAEQRVVETGLRQDGLYEITKGLAGGETLVVDGAGFLTHGAPVQLPKPRPEAGKGEKGGGKPPAAGEGGKKPEAKS